MPPWELTDAIDAGNTATALALLARMSGAGRAPPAAADGRCCTGTTAGWPASTVSTPTYEAAAAAALGIKPGFPAKKALQQYRGSAAAGCSGRSTCSPAADLDLRGAKDLPDDVVMDVLVARLSRLPLINPVAHRPVTGRQSCERQAGARR